MAHCGCTNGRRGKKNMHKTRGAALEQAMKFMRNGLGHTPYPCPKVEGVWHVRTERKRLG